MTDEERQAGHDPTRISIHCLRREKLTLDASAIVAATWDGLELFSAEALEVPRAISIGVAVSLTSIARIAGIAAFLTHVREARDLGNGRGEGEKRYGYRQEGTGRTPPYISHFVRRWYPSGRDST